MRTKQTAGQDSPGLKRYLSPVGVWALAFGCSVGWGAFVMPGTTFLPISGPLGTAIGIAIGTVIMLIIGRNYHYMMNRYPDAGGAFTYTKKVFNYDHGFLSGWFLILTYIAIIWANATALALIGRKLLGDLFQFGFHYQIAGFDIYLGEALLSAAAIVLFGALCVFRKRMAGYTQSVMAVVLFAGIVVCFAAVLGKHEGGAASFAPAFSPEGAPPVQVFHIVALAPWAFVGFESISHSTAEFRFAPKKAFRIMVIALITGALAYILLAEMAAAIQPEGYGNWAEYIADIGKLDGLSGLPTFFAANTAMGKAGLILLGVTVLGGIVTGLVGNFIAASRLLYAMADDGILPKQFGKLDRNGTPRTAILFLMAISIFIPFLGRTAIGWIVDITTIGATIAYGYTSAAAYRQAKTEGNRHIMITGLIGLVLSLVFALYFLVPNFWSVSAFSTESYLILIAWSILGFVVFRFVLKKDRKQRLGKTTITWIALLFLIFFSSLMWMRQTTHSTTESVVNNVSEHYMMKLEKHGVDRSDEAERETEEYMEDQMDRISVRLTESNLIQIGLIVVALGIMFNIYTHITEQEKEMEIQKVQAEKNNKAKSTFLSNMSHDIRTPMNAIIGYTTLAKQEPDLPPRVEEYLDKIDRSNRHLLDLLSDVLEMSRIESGKVTLNPAPTDLKKTMRDLEDMFATQMETKRIRYTVDADGVKNPWVLCDESHLNRVLLNLISNAYKYTPENGSVAVTLTQTEQPDGSPLYVLRVKDSGIGMSPEFASRIFEAFEREQTSTVSGIQGTGLGMSITKNIVEMMGGAIEVDSRQGEGTEFIVRLPFQPTTEPEETEEAEPRAEVWDFSGKRVLLAEDNEVNREIATLLLRNVGCDVDAAENGKVAVEKIAGSHSGDYDVVLMDIQMPVMNGYDATKAIRALDDPGLSGIPIIAMTANVFSEDIHAAKDAGINGHISKPIDTDKMMKTLAEVFAK